MTKNEKTKLSEEELENQAWEKLWSFADLSIDIDGVIDRDTFIMQGKERFKILEKGSDK